MILSFLVLVLVTGCVSLDDNISDGITEERLQLIENFAQNENVQEHVQQSNESGDRVEFVFRVNNETDEGHVIYNIITEEFEGSLDDEEKTTFNIMCQTLGASMILGQQSETQEIDEDLPEDIEEGGFNLVYMSVQDSDENIIHECISTEETLDLESFLPGWLSYLT